MQSVGASIDSELVICLIPLWLQVSNEHLSQFVASQSINMANIRLENPQEIMKEWAIHAGVEIIDLLPGFRQWVASGQRDLILGVDEHWNEAGHRLAASIVSDALISRKIIAPIKREPASAP